MALSVVDSGTATVEQGDIVVTGQDTTWLLQVTAGDFFGSHVGEPIRIKRVDSNTQLILAYTWPGPDQDEFSYEIQTVSDSRRYAENVRNLLTQLQQGLWLDPDATGTLAERAAYDGVRRGFIYMRTDTNPFVVYVKATDDSGDWSAGQILVGPQGNKGDQGLKGDPWDQWQGAWQSGSDYVVNDAVSDSGSSYIATADHTAASANKPGVGANWQDAWGILVDGSDAEADRVAAAASASAASTSEQNASNSEDAAAASATAASTSEGNASDSAGQSASSASDAETAQGAAETSAGNAATSEANAAGSASDANDSAGAAATSETNAATSETNAAGSAGDASDSAGEAAGSETNASDSADAAATSETNAAGSASAAATSETNAATSANAAHDSETSASGSAQTASTKASQASTSASDAQDARGGAETAQGGAETAQALSEQARDASQDAFDSFDDRYLGSKAADPTTDNDGEALVEGALYWRSAAPKGMRIYNGTEWEAAFVPSSSSVSSIFGRTGAVAAQPGDYSADQISYDGDIDADNIGDAADTLQAQISTIPDPVAMAIIFGS